MYSRSLTALLLLTNNLTSVAYLDPAGFGPRTSTVLVFLSTSRTLPVKRLDCFTFSPSRDHPASLGRLARAGLTLFSTQAATWMASRRGNRRTTVARDESYMTSLVLPHFGRFPLSAVTVESVEAWVSNMLDGGKAPATIRKAFQLASGVLSSAVRARRIPRNPADGVSLPPLERSEQRFLTVDEIHDLADTIDSKYRLMVLLGGYAGLRFGELAALKVSSLGVGLRTVTVTETLTDVRGQVTIGPPKTRAGVRTVSLPGFLVGELEQHLAAMDPADGLLFPSPAGGPIRPSNWRRRVWAPAVNAAGFGWCTPHSLRHSQVALLIEAGEQPLTIAKRLGHTSVRTVLDVYGHLFPGADEAAAEKLDEKSRTRRAPSPVVELSPRAKTQS